MRRLYVAAVVLLVIPIWSAGHLPTVDGASHVYNAEIIRHIVTGRDSVLTHAFRLNPRPVPNWSGHAVLALLLMLFSAATAEKLLMTGIIALFMTGIWMYTGCDDEARHVYAFFAIPLAYNQLFQFGFYNYAISIGLSLIAISSWWRRRNIAITALLLVACYFSHPLTTALTVFTLFVCWIVRSREPRQLLMFVPVAPLLGWYVLSQHGLSKVFEPMSLSIGWAYLSKTQLLLTFDPRQLIFGRVYFALFVVLFVVTFIRQSIRSEANVFLALTIVYLLLYYVMNSNSAGGAFVHERFALVFMLTPLAWFTPRIPARALIVAFMLVAVAELLFLIKHYQSADHVVTRFLASMRGLGSHSSMIPLLANYEAKPGSVIAPVIKAINYVAVERELVNLDNYEAGTDYFPVVFAPSVQPDVGEIESYAFRLDAARYATTAEWIFTWKFDEQSYLAKEQLPSTYTLTAVNGDGRIYRSIYRPAINEP